MMAACTGVSPMTRTLAAAALLTLLTPVSQASATPFWFGWFGHDRPVIYRPIVTPETFYFQPAPQAHAAPAPRHPIRHCRVVERRCR
jgi:hypothetical protein